MSNQITEISEEKYLHEQPVRVFLPFDDLIDPNDEKVIDGELHIRHIDGQFRKVSLKMVTKLFLEARLAAVQENDDEEGDGECGCPACTLERELHEMQTIKTEPPEYLTVKDYAEEFGLVLETPSEMALVGQAGRLSLAHNVAPRMQKDLMSTMYHRSILAQAFQPILNRH